MYGEDCIFSSGAPEATVWASIGYLFCHVVPPLLDDGQIRIYEGDIFELSDTAENLFYLNNNKINTDKLKLVDVAKTNLIEKYRQHSLKLADKLVRSW